MHQPNVKTYQQYTDGSKTEQKVISMFIANISLNKKQCQISLYYGMQNSMPL